MKPLFALIKVSFKRLLLNTFSFGSGKKKAATSIASICLLGFLMLYVSGSLALGMGFMLIPMGGTDIMLGVMLLLAVAFPLVLTLFTAQGVVFSTKDADLVLSLPVSTASVMLSRVLALYLEVLLMVELLLLPAGIIVGVMAGNWVPLPLLLVLGVFLALLPTSVSLLFGGLLSLVVSRLKFKNLFSVLISLVFMVGIFYLSFGMNTALENIVIDIDAMRAGLFGNLPPLAWAVLGVYVSPEWLLPTIALCLVPFLLLIWLFSKVFLSVLTLLSSHAMRGNYKFRRMRTSGRFAALLKKEARRFFGTPIYLLNSCIGLLLMAIAAVYVFIRGDVLLEMLVGQNIPASWFSANNLGPILLLLMGFLLSMTELTAVSLSLEGNRLWILKEAPLGAGRIFAAKITFPMLIILPVVLLCGILFGTAFSLPALDILGILVACCLYGVYNQLFGLVLNLLMPRMDGDNDTAVVKQSASGLLSFVASWVIIGFMGGLYIFYRLTGISFALFCASIAGLLLLLCGGCTLWLAKVGKKRFEAL